MSQSASNTGLAAQRMTEELLTAQTLLRFETIPGMKKGGLPRLFARSQPIYLV
jgi:hypothetical protein